MIFRVFRPAWMLLAVLAAGSPVVTAEPDAARSSYWHERDTFFRTFGGRADVVMLGDSLTDGAEWRELFPRQQIVNRGIDGDTADGLLERLDAVLALRPRQVFVMIGINDLRAQRSVEAVFADYRTLVARLAAAGAQVIVQSTLPCSPDAASAQFCVAANPQVRQLNARLTTVAAGPVRYLDLTPLLADAGGLKTGLSFDGIHLNGAGYRLWQRAIAPLMGPPGTDR
jgi:lysophospholipase L1-like esterase